MAAMEELAERWGRRALLANGAYSLAALAVPGFSEVARAGPGPVLGRKAGVPVEMFEVDSAAAMLEMFHAGDAAFGGGHGRRALAGYLAADLVPRLRRPAAPQVRARLLEVAGQLVYLCAFMCYDDELHRHAQRYYLTALRLAAENNDGQSYAVPLRGMSVQAQRLGHHRQAVQLAEAAASGVALPMQQAFVYGQLALARAGSGDRRGALTAFARAERLLERASSPATATVGAYHYASLLHQQAEMQVRLGDRAGSLAVLRQSVDHRPVHERRSRAVVLARLAELELDCGRLEQAVAPWHRFLDDCPGLSSGRVRGALMSLGGRLRPYARHSGVQSLLHRAARVLAAG
nr:hypothetical protein [Streptomyces polyasparticus]